MDMLALVPFCVRRNVKFVQIRKGAEYGAYSGGPDPGRAPAEGGGDHGADRGLPAEPGAPGPGCRDHPGLPPQSDAVLSGAAAGKAGGPGHPVPLAGRPAGPGLHRPDGERGPLRRQQPAGLPGTAGVPAGPAAGRGAPSPPPCGRSCWRTSGGGSSPAGRCS